MALTPIHGAIAVAMQGKSGQYVAAAIAHVQGGTSSTRSAKLDQKWLLQRYTPQLRIKGLEQIPIASLGQSPSVGDEPARAHLEMIGRLMPLPVDRLTAEQSDGGLA